jgi:hypothetical protein
MGGSNPTPGTGNNPFAQALFDLKQQADLANSKPSSRSKSSSKPNPLLGSKKDICQGEDCIDIRPGYDLKKEDRMRHRLYPDARKFADPEKMYQPNWARNPDGSLVREVPSFNLDPKGKVLMVFVNPTARAGEIGEQKAEIVKHFYNKGAHTVIVHDTVAQGNIGHVKGLIWNAHMKYPGKLIQVAALGGDGTAQQVFEAARQANLEISPPKSGKMIPIKPVAVGVPMQGGTASDLGVVAGAPADFSKQIDFVKSGQVVWNFPLEAKLTFANGSIGPVQSNHTIHAGATGELFEKFDDIRSKRIAKAKAELERIEGRERNYPTIEKYNQALDKAQVKLKRAKAKTIADYVRSGFKAFPQYIAGKSFKCVVKVNGVIVYEGRIAALEVNNIGRMAGLFRVPGANPSLGGQSTLTIIPPGPKGLIYLMEIYARDQAYKKLGASKAIYPGNNLALTGEKYSIPLPPGSTYEVVFTDKPAPTQASGDAEGFVQEIKGSVSTKPYPMVVAADSVSGQTNPYRGLEGRFGQERFRAGEVLKSPTTIAEALTQGKVGPEFLDWEQRLGLLDTDAKIELADKVAQLSDQARSLRALETGLVDSGLTSDQIRRILQMKSAEFDVLSTFEQIDGKALTSEQLDHLSKLRSATLASLTEPIAMLGDEGFRRLLLMTDGEFRAYTTEELQQGRLKPHQVQELQNLRASHYTDAARAFDMDEVNRFLNSENGQALQRNPIFQELVLSHRELFSGRLGVYTLREITPEFSFQFLQLLALEGCFGIPGLLDQTGFSKDRPLARLTAITTALIATEQVSALVQLNFQNYGIATKSTQVVLGPNSTMVQLTGIHPFRGTIHELMPYQRLTTFTYWKHLGLGLARASFAGRVSRELAHTLGAEPYGEVSHTVGLFGMGFAMIPSAYMDNLLQATPRRVHPYLQSHGLVRALKGFNLFLLASETSNILGGLIFDPLANDEEELYYENAAYYSHLADNSQNGVLKSIGSDVPYSRRVGYTFDWIFVNGADVFASWLNKKYHKHSPFGSRMQSEYLWEYAAQYRDNTEENLVQIAINSTLNSSLENPEVDWEGIKDLINNGDDEATIAFRAQLKTWHKLSYMCKDPHRVFTKGGINENGKIQDTAILQAWLKDKILKALPARIKGLEESRIADLAKVRELDIHPDQKDELRHIIKIGYQTMINRALVYLKTS